MTAGEQDRRREGRRSALRVFSLILWGVLIAFVGYNAILHPSAVNIISAVAFLLLFVVVHAQLLLSRWIDEHRVRVMAAKLTGTGYISELQDLPNRNYLLSELRREMPRARGEDAPFTLIVFELDDIDGVEERRGSAFKSRAVNSAAELLQRVTRSSDFLAHLGEARFCVVLTECTYEQGFVYLKRVPGSIAVGDGRRMLDIRFTARMMQYDMESMYATDVLHDAEESPQLRRKEPARLNSIAA